MGRYYEKTTITISEDTSSQPKQIRFADESEDTDILSLTKVRDLVDTYPVGSNALSLGQITTGKFVWIKPSADVTLVIEGQNLKCKAGKASKLWTEFTTLAIDVPNTTANTSKPPLVSLVIGG